MQNSVDVDYVINDREKDPVGKSLGQNAPHPIANTQNGEQMRRLLGATKRFDYFVCQFLTESHASAFIPRRCLGNIFHGQRPNDHSPDHSPAIRCFTVSFSSSKGIPAPGFA